MNAIIVSCGKCKIGQVPLTPDEDGECHCIQCGARHNINGEPIVSEEERRVILKAVSDNDNGNGNGGEPEGIHYDVQQIHRRVHGGFVYGNGCSHHPDCLICPKKDCEASYRYPRMTANKAYFRLTHSKGSA